MNTIKDRTRTFNWSDPMVAAKKAMKMSGYDYLDAVCKSEIPFPPVMSMLGVDTASIEEGRMRIEFNPEEYHYNTIGGVHGGVFSILLDSCMSCAVHTTLPQGVGFATLELKVNFFRPITMETGVVICEGQVIHSGRKTASSEGKLLDMNGELLAVGTTTCLIL